MKIKRSYTATDPLNFNGEYTGSDTIGIADLPYKPDKCEELTDHSHTPAPPPGAPPPQVAGAAAAPSAAPTAGSAATAPSSAAAEKPAPAKPWWKFWE